MKIGKDPKENVSGQVMFRLDPEVHCKAALAAEQSGNGLSEWAEEVRDQAIQMTGRRSALRA